MDRGSVTSSTGRLFDELRMAIDSERLQNVITELEVRLQRLEHVAARYEHAEAERATRALLEARS